MGVPTQNKCAYREEQVLSIQSRASMRSVAQLRMPDYLKTLNNLATGRTLALLLQQLCRRQAPLHI